MRTSTKLTWQSWVRPVMSVTISQSSETARRAEGLYVSGVCWKRMLFFVVSGMMV